MFCEHLFEFRKIDIERIRAEYALFKKFIHIFDESDFAKLALIVEGEAIVVGESKEHSCMRRCLSLLLEIMKRTSHAEMQSQPDIAIGVHEQMLAMTATGFETAPFQPECKLTR